MRGQHSDKRCTKPERGVLRVIQKILVPVDLLNEGYGAIETALHLAYLLNAGVDILHIWTPRVFASTGANQKREEKGNSGTTAVFVSQLMSRPLCPIRLLLEPGIPAPLIMARSKDYDLIVMGGNQMPRWKQDDSIDRQVIRGSECPVLSVRI